ncbi:thiol reductant ABC exporter subunit CydC [Gryllotalpicola sp.]|uniref:thiol reductant ABC exporter subunit CydC n=1 Tax=Gryllotalpicola sp. TaxID=1932787 RepID=UPI00263050F0|nr:thiol reductant ABC exporter subunit CydC [Gryllotalpicola sp.]
MRPVLADIGKGRLYLLGLLGALKALGLILVAGALAGALSALLAGADSWQGSALLGVLGVLVRAVATWLLQGAAAGTAAGATARLREQVLRRAVRSRASTGQTAVLATTALDELDRYYTVFLPSLVQAATVPLLVGARILVADWVSALIIVLTVPLIPVFMILIGVRTRESVAAAMTTLGRLSDHLVELARGLPVLVGLGRARAQEAALREISEEHRRTSMAALRVAFLSALALELIATISVALVAVFVGVRLVSGTMTLDAGLIALILAPECYAPLREIGTAFHASQNGVEARRRVQALLDELEPEAGIVWRETDGDLRVDALTVQHADRPSAVVSGLSFEAPGGSIVSIEGASGTGKTTVLEVLAGRGALLATGAAVTGTVRRPAGIAWLPQHPHTSAPTVAEEVERFGAPDPAAPLAAVGLAHLAAADPARLSPGELRRLAMARVLARVSAGARLALLDEPTAHLDGESAALVREAIAGLRAHTTVVLASHDPAVRALADIRVPVAGASPTPADLSPAERSAAIPRRTRPDLPTLPTPAGLPWRALREYLRPAVARFAAAAAVGALAALFAAALTAVSGWLILRAAEHPHILYLMVAIVGVRFFGIGRAALRYSERLLTHDAVFRALTALRLRLWGGLAAQGPSGRQALTAANTLDRLVGDADAVRDLAPRVLLPPATAVITIAAAGVALGLLLPAAGWLIAAAALLALVGGGAAAIAADRRASRLRDLDRSAVVRESTGLLAARDDLDGNGVADAVIDRIVALDASATARARRAAWSLGAGAAVAVAVLGLAAFALVAVGAGPVLAGGIPAPVAGVLALTALALIDPVLEAIQAAQRWGELRQVLGRVDAVTAATRPDAGGAELTAADRLELAEVAYRYPGAARDAFADVSAAVERGEWLAVTGPSGSGKSTLLGVLLRYLEPTAGEYRIDGEPAAGIDGDAVRRRISWCPQEGHLFTSTLRGNLALARARADTPDDAELAAALREVGLAGLIAELPLGLDTPIGAEGSFLSGGQRQRVAVARTLLARADAVLLDEPTAHLDEESAIALMADMRAALCEKTVVLVTHDRSVVGTHAVRLSESHIPG